VTPKNRDVKSLGLGLEYIPVASFRPDIRVGRDPKKS